MKTDQARKKLFLTGGTGFFGKSMLDSGVLDAYDVTILSRDPDSFRKSFAVSENVHFLRGDVCSFAFPKEKFDCVIHGAATAKPDISDAENYEVIVNGTKRVLELAKCSSVKRFLCISSGAVYGVQEPELYGISEEHPLSPVTAYGRAKAEAERLAFESGIECVAARCFAFIGKYLPRKNTHFAAGNFLDDVLSDRPVIIRGDGRNFRSYMDADDLSRALMVLLEKGTAGEAYNVGSGEAVSILELARTILRVSGKDLPVRVLTPPQDGLPSRYVPDITRLSKLFTPEITLADSVERILRETPH